MLLSLLTTLVVLTFVMSLGAVLKLAGIVAGGAPAMAILRLFAAGLPASLIFTLPVSALVSSLLVFGRLSADGEITAMRASGVSLYRIVLPPFAVGAVLAIVCIFVSDKIASRAHFEQRRIVRELFTTAPMDLIKEGMPIRFGGASIYVGTKKGNRLETIRVQQDMPNGRFRYIDADSGSMRVATNGVDLILELQDVMIDPVMDDRPGAARMQSWPIVIPNASRSGGTELSDYDMTFNELRERVDGIAKFYPNLDPQEQSVRRMIYLIELQRRWVLSLACIVFVALGAPLGIKAHRRESSIGVAISLGVVFVFYMFMLTAASLARLPQLHPHLILWIPVVLSMALSTHLIRKGN